MASAAVVNSSGQIGHVAPARSRAHGTPGGNEWFWGLNRRAERPGPSNGFAQSLEKWPTLEDAKARCWPGDR
jgi:hypothetical protein